MNEGLSICGEMAHKSEFIPFLLGIGIHAFGVYPTYLPAVQKTICKFKLLEAEIYADQLLAKGTRKEVCATLIRLAIRYDLSL